jgi:hypothetical protein
MKWNAELVDLFLRIDWVFRTIYQRQSFEIRSAAIRDYGFIYNFRSFHRLVAEIQDAKDIGVIRDTLEQRHLKQMIVSSSAYARGSALLQSLRYQHALIRYASGFRFLWSKATRGRDNARC